MTPVLDDDALLDLLGRTLEPAAAEPRDADITALHAALAALPEEAGTSAATGLAPVVSLTSGAGVGRDHPRPTAVGRVPR